MSDVYWPVVFVASLIGLVLGAVVAFTDMFDDE